jgi:hypothetical protein
MLLKQIHKELDNMQNAEDINRTIYMNSEESPESGSCGCGCGCDGDKESEQTTCGCESGCTCQN